MAVEDRFANLNPKTCVVLGGRGFVGRSLVLRLLKLGNWIVRIADSAQSLQLHHSESLLQQALSSSSRASYFHVDLRDKRSIIKGAQFCLCNTLSPRDFLSISFEMKYSVYGK